MIFLRNTYAFSTIVIDGLPHVALAPGDGPVSATAVSKHREILAERLRLPTIYLVPEITKPGLRKLVDADIPFIVPRRHLHLPGRVIEIGNRFAHVVDDLMRPSNPGALTPTAQAMVIRRILKLDQGNVPSMFLASDLRVRSQTSLKASKEIVAAGLAIRGPHGRSGSLEFVSDGRDLFERALPLLQSPLVLTQHYCGSGQVKGRLVGGETALGRQTLLGEPRVPVFATGRKDRMGIGYRSGLERCLEVDADYTVDVWRYSPDATSNGEIVDPVSLYLQFRDHPDERVSKAASDILEAAFE
jgi:hypothetical protein